MRQLFLAVLGAAGSLFLDLHALAINTDTSTFIGQVSPHCEIEDLEENYELDWRLGGLRKSVPFTISSNTDVSISYKYEQVQAPVGANPSEIFVLFEGLTQVRRIDNSPNTYSTPKEITLNSENNANLRLSVVLYQGSIHRSIPPGSYTYKATITCLF